MFRKSLREKSGPVLKSEGSYQFTSSQGMSLLLSELPQKIFPLVIIRPSELWKSGLYGMIWTSIARGNFRTTRTSCITLWDDCRRVTILSFWRCIILLPRRYARFLYASLRSIRLFSRVIYISRIVRLKESMTPVPSMTIIRVIRNTLSRGIFIWSIERERNILRVKLYFFLFFACFRQYSKVCLRIWKSGGVVSFFRVKSWEIFFIVLWFGIKTAYNFRYISEHLTTIIITKAYFWNFYKIYIFCKESMDFMCWFCQWFWECFTISESADIHVSIWEIWWYFYSRNGYDSVELWEFRKFPCEVLTDKFLWDSFRFFSSFLFHRYLFFVYCIIVLSYSRIIFWQIKIYNIICVLYYSLPREIEYDIRNQKRKWIKREAHTSL